MKKTITLTVMLFIVLAFTKAQTTYVLDDFESGAVSFTTEVHVNPADNMLQAVVDNHVVAGLNTSTKVWKWTRQDAATDQQWAGFWANLVTAIPAGYTSIEVKFLRTNATSQLRIKCVGAITKEFSSVNTATKTNEWETIVFDLIGNGIQDITQISLFPDYYTPIDVAAISYIDEIKIVYDPSIVPPPAPTSEILFDNSANNRFRDQSWSPKATAPSTLVLEHWQGAGLPDGDKFPVVTSPVKAGANALKLQWISAVGGDWSILLAGDSWKSIDVSTMDNLKFWVNSPVTLSKSALPKLFLEAHSGNPKITGKIQMSNYLTVDIAANTWTEVVIPLADFWAADATFAAKNVIKGVFFQQNATDNVEHTLYMDEFTFNEVSSTVLMDFGDPGASNISASPWNNVTNELTTKAATALNDNLGNSTGYSLTTTGNFQMGYNTSGTTAPAGDAAALGFPATATKDNFYIGINWGSPAANILLASFDISGLDPSKYYSFSIFGSRAGVSDIRSALYTITGNASTGKTATLNASNNTSNVASIIDIMPTAAGVISFSIAPNADNNHGNKFAYLGAIKMLRSDVPTVLTGLANQTKNGLNGVYYNNGYLRLNDYTGMVKVYSVDGRLIKEANAIFGYLQVNIQKGAYVINTEIGTTKLVVN